MAENTEQKKEPVDAAERYAKLAADNRYLTFLLKCYVEHHTGEIKLNNDLLGSLTINAKHMVDLGKPKSPECRHQKTKWNIQFTSGTCQDCGKHLEASDY
jgi:hypothetical protein